MKRHVAALAFLGLALGTQACNITVDLPKVLPSLLVAGSTPPKPPSTTCAGQLKDLDTDGDGALNISEFNTVVNPPSYDCPACGVGRPPQDPEPVLKKFDTNKDGKLQQDELCAYLDRNAPSPTPAPTAAPTSLPSAIVEPPPPSVRPTVQPSATPTAKPTAAPAGTYTATPAAFEALDADQDGKVTWDEEVAYQSRNGALPAGAKDKIYDLFRQADTNQNGTLERSEYDFAKS
jgi:Ca2+-binding EF-hand superfamily protein